jgi:hypothetical protein
MIHDGQSLLGNLGIAAVFRPMSAEFVQLGGDGFNPVLQVLVNFGRG